MHRNPTSSEGRAERQLADLLGTGNVADVQNHNRWAITQICFLSVGADQSGPVKGDILPGWLVAFFLAAHPPAPGFFGILGIADVQKHEDLSAISRHVSRETGVF